MDDASDLIERLCMAAAMVMEDEVEAALVGSTTRSPSACIEAITRAGCDISALASAAEVIARRWENAGSAN